MAVHNGMTNRPLIILIDDDQAVRDSTRALLETGGYRVADYESALAYLADSPAGDCLITDVRMPRMDGLELQRVLTHRGDTIPIILISGHGDIPTAVRAMRAGAVDFVEKPFDDEMILASIRLALQRAEPPEKSPEAEQAEQLLATLTPRERAVFAQLILGRSNKLAAFELGLSTRTVQSHRARILGKLNARSISDLVRLSLAASLISIKR